MKFLTMFREESNLSFPRLLLVAAIAGVCNAVLLAIVNHAAEEASDERVSIWYLAQFLVVVAIWTTAQRHVMTRTADEVERVLHQIRVRIAAKVRDAGLPTFERIGRAEIYASIHRDTSTISQASLVLIDGAQSALIVLFTTLYIAYLSKTAFVLTIAFVSLALSMYFRRRLPLRQAIHESAERENRLWDLISSLLDGFKSVRLHRPRSDALFADVQEVSREAMDLKIKARHLIAGQFIFSQVAFLFLLATMAFIVPRFGGEAYGDVVIKTTTAVLFMIGPVGSIVGAIPTLAEANDAAEGIYDLEGRLAEGSYRARNGHASLARFERIELDHVTFQYADDPGVSVFSLGPITASINAGEITFISGGNGAGKSTLLKVLTGLYPPTAGRVRVDGLEITDTNRDVYHTLFAVVFSDFHLFRRLYGISGAEPERIAELLARIELEHKTSVADGQFSHLDLSSGQRKRVALMVSVLEDRPVLVFDEWAADQDPLFRRKFYEELLPGLKQAGKTVIAVTHDDRYYGVADRLLEMREGRLVERTS